MNTRYLVFGVYFHHSKEIFYVNTNFMGNNHEITNNEVVSVVDVEKTLYE